MWFIIDRNEFIQEQDLRQHVPPFSLLVPLCASSTPTRSQYQYIQYLIINNDRERTSRRFAIAASSWPSSLRAFFDKRNRLSATNKRNDKPERSMMWSTFSLSRRRFSRSAAFAARVASSSPSSPPIAYKSNSVTFGLRYHCTYGKSSTRFGELFALQFASSQSSKRTKIHWIQQSFF